MLIHAAEQSFRKGIRSLSVGRLLESTAFFEAALELEKQFSVDPPQARYLSYFGLCIGLARNRYHEAVELCRGAIELEPFNADLHLNLGRLLLQADRRRDAHVVLMSGLGIHPDHSGIQRMLREMGLRKRPILPFLARTNPINVMLGRIGLGN